MAFEGLPGELMTLIFVKLPVKTLLRCKCVRKSWYSLIKSPQFIHFHHLSSSSASPQFIFRRCVEEEEKEPRHVLSFYSYETLEDLANDITVPLSNHVNSYGDFGELSLSVPCDGLVCITNHHDQIFICNPAMRELRSLFVPPSFCNRSGYHIDSVAFGSDPKTGEYKVVMIGVSYDNSDDYDPDIPDEDCIIHTPPEEDMYGDREAKVYDFSTDSWRETAVVIPGPFRYSQRAVSLNGAFHWCPETWRDQKIWNDLNDHILTFRMSDEVTESIPLPDFVDKNHYMELRVSRKSQLSLVVWVQAFELGARFEVCVMTEYGVKESWTRLFQTGPFMDIWGRLTFWGDQQLLLLTTRTQQLVSCDLQHPNHLRYFRIHGVLDVFPYSESLVSVNMLPPFSLVVL